MVCKINQCGEKMDALWHQFYDYLEVEELLKGRTSNEPLILGFTLP